MKLGDLSTEIYRTFESDLKKSLPSLRTLEEVGARATSSLYSKFKDSIVLTRLYATLPYYRLPESDQRFLQSVPKFARVAHLIGRDTTILSLMGSAGEAPEWNARLHSKGHLGIPLVSQEFVETLPMVSRTLKDLGVAMTGLNTAKEGMETSTFGRLGGMFYVDEAGKAKDEQGRLIIPAQDFVQRYGVQTVFGTVGRYIAGGTYVVLIAFCRDQVTKYVAHEFMSLGNAITASTVGVAQTGRYFG